MTVAESNSYTRQAMKLPNSFNYDLLCRRIRVTRPRAHELMHYWRRRGWISNVGIVQFQKTMIFGRTGTDRFSHLQPQIFPATCISRSDRINAGLTELMKQHAKTRNRIERDFLADRIELLMVSVVKSNEQSTNPLQKQKMKS